MSQEKVKQSKQYENNRLRKDPRFSSKLSDAYCGSVLLRDEIKYYCREHSLIEEFNEDNLQPASYDLSLGSKNHVGAKPKVLDDKERYLEISPYDVAVVSTHEKLNLPLFIIGRWNLRVHYAYEGLLWVGGPQVDPGYRGHLYAPIYNLSNRVVRLEYRRPFATIDFVRTTPYDEEKSGPPFASRRKDDVDDHDRFLLSSGPMEANRTVTALRERIEEINERVERYVAIFFTTLAIIIAAATMVFASTQKMESQPINPFIILSIIISIGALFISIYALRIKDP